MNPPTIDNDRKVIMYDDKEYSLEKIGMILRRDAKQQQYKKHAYLSYRNTDKGREAQKRASKAHYHRKKQSKVQPQNPEIPPENI